MGKGCGWRWVLGLLGLWMGLAQLAAAEDVPAVPAGHVLDAAGLFDRHPEQLEVISGRLIGLQVEHEVPVYLVIYGGLLESSIERRTRQLYDAWIGKYEDGLLVVWDSDTGGLEFGTPMGSYYDLGDESAPATRLPDHRLGPVLNEVVSSVEGIEDKAAYVERLSMVLTTRLGWMMRDGQPQGGVSAGTVAIATLAFGGVLGLLGLWAGKFLRKSEVEAGRRCYFPDVLVGGRLGASFGGGRIAVVDYKREEPEEEE